MSEVKSSFTGKQIDDNFTPPENLVLDVTLNVNSYNDDTGVYACERLVDINCDIHWHDVLEMELFTGGEGTLQVNDRIFEIKPGLINFVNYHDFHEIIVKKPISLWHLHFENIAIESTLLGRLLDDEMFVCYLDNHDLSSLTVLMRALSEGHNIPHERRKAYMTGLLQALIVQFLSSFEKQPAEGEHVGNFGNNMTISDLRGSKRFRGIQSAIQYINLHFTEKIMMSKIAEMFFLDEHYFSSRFHQIAGMTFTEYLRNLRLEYAAGLLWHSDHTVKQIAIESGYGSYNSFVRDFTRYYGSPPLKIRSLGSQNEGSKLKIKPDDNQNIRTITPIGE